MSSNFLNSYKQLDKLCDEILNNIFSISGKSGVSSYIEEMENITQGSRFVNSWDRDLKQLKHYRWVRNKIVHEPNCTEKSMCKPVDVQWLDDFYSRIMNQTDPISLYSKATNTSVKSKKHAIQEANDCPAQYANDRSVQINNNYKEQKVTKTPTGWILFIIIAIIIFLILNMRYGIIK